MTQGQLQQMFSTATRNGGPRIITTNFGNDRVQCRWTGCAVFWSLNGKHIEWDRLQARCDDY